FFFQAEDGIRDDLVTGVQTCALPICDSAQAYVRAGVVPGGWLAARIEAIPGGDRGLAQGRSAQARFFRGLFHDGRLVRKDGIHEIGRASCRERGEVEGVGVSVKEEQE